MSTPLSAGPGPASSVNIFERVAAGKWKLRTVIATEEESGGKQPRHMSGMVRP